MKANAETIADCKDPKCPIHGTLSTHGSIVSGRVVSSKAAKTAIVEIPYTVYLHKYERYLRKKSRIPAYNPLCLAAKEGDLVKIAESRKLSKTKAFAVIEIVKRA
ncbi:MAG: 30S ribosomal protein S17 [Candidatus Micrarchaeaceae archaeon]